MEWMRGHPQPYKVDMQQCHRHYTKLPRRQQLPQALHKQEGAEQQPPSQSVTVLKLGLEECKGTHSLCM